VPAIDTTQPSLFAQAFTQRLLTRDFATCSRTEELQWLQYEGAPVPWDQVPEPWRSLAIATAASTAVSGAGDEGTPVPSTELWRQYADDRASEHVTGVAVSPDPAGEGAIAQGYVTDDPLTTALDVSAQVRLELRPDGLAGPGQRVTETVQFTLTLGTAAHYRGYGAEGIADYSESL
jgi:hypothetical protein